MDPTTLLLAVAVFTVVIVGLVGLLTAAKSQLVAEGTVTVLVNGERSVEVEPGQTLLSAMASQQIFIPSACGGGGTCAMCKCRVIEGGGDVLPTEVGQLSLRERKEDVRLSCQVKIKQDLKIEVPEEVFGVKKFAGTVISNANVATFIKELVVQLPDDVEMDFEPGGYIQIDVPLYNCTFRDFDIDEKYHEDWDRFKFWDIKAFNDEEGVFRAYSMANCPAEGNIVMLNIRIATAPRGMDVPPGVCSSYVFNLKPGDKITMSGPYGEFAINETEREMIYVGGGAGMAPLRSQLYHLFNTLKTGRKVSYWYGARSKREIFYEEEFRAIEREYPNFRFIVALSDPQEEDDWEGPVGFIHQIVIDHYLSKHDAPEDCEYYFCGPPLMLKAVLKMCDDYGVPEENVRFDDFG
ncbi:MAG: NADH:ubiquinone reductase (Na(+)-transporting) subunit F [Myxococcales bacterium]|nr:NADH:ubiquinone reductase (Na(+)-transporting) subunit F [Myxococcales bacterium]